MENLQEENKIELGQDALSYLNTTRKWTMFFAILGFIFIGLMLLGCVIAGVLLNSLPGLSEFESVEDMESVGLMGGAASIMLIVFIVIFAIIYFFPFYYLLRFSQHTSRAIKKLSAEELTIALRNLKAYWLYIGVLVIIVLSVYLLIFIISGTSFAFLSRIFG